MRNGLLLAASYFFYGWWSWKFLLLILLSTLVDFSCALAIKAFPQRKRLYLGLSLATNLGILTFFKYYNFFIESFHQGFKLLGSSASIETLQIILPVGISFYTFQTMSYTIDVYRKKLEPTQNLLAFSVFVAFFPQLVAGPIERATHLLPQFLQVRRFNYIRTLDGLRQILWGLFKKIVIADTCGRLIDPIYANYYEVSGSTLVVAALLFSVQIYADFSGYSDIAIGTARLFSINLRPNFAYPLFAKSIPNFWSRWHISLLSWFRDYIYIPLGGNRKGRLRTYFNIMVVFLVSGLWHGAASTFILYGFIHGLLYVAFIVGRKYTGANFLFRMKSEWLAISVVFLVVSLTRILFRAASLEQARGIWSAILSDSLFTVPLLNIGTVVLILLVLFLGIEWLGRKYEHPLQGITKFPVFGRWLVYYAFIGLILYFAGEPRAYIYFQF